MAGFIFSVDKKTNLDEIIFNGYFVPKTPNDATSTQAQITIFSTLGDFYSMKDNDNVYFFKKRKIYGIGKIIKVKENYYYENYFESTILRKVDDETIYLTPYREQGHRWLFLFEPDNRFFSEGIDMDDVLRYKPKSFRMLRAFQDRSFIKIDDEENAALKEILYLRNKGNKESKHFSDEFHKELSTKDLNKYRISLDKLIQFSKKDDTTLKLESILEAILVKQISELEIFGHKWDYVSHQVIASPFKPLAYIDKIDIFAYKFLEYPHENKPIEKYLVIELKKDDANQETIEQTMKYVDWICEEYASGDYSLIKALVIANKYTRNAFNNIVENTNRTFIKSTHPIVTEKWDDLECYAYECTNEFKVELKKVK